MRPTVYIETTIPSYYCDDRAELVHEIHRTRQWWDHERGSYECFTSVVVLDELSGGTYTYQPACLVVVEPLPLVAVVTEVLEIAEAYQARKVMPRHPAADAIHLALASFYRMDFLLTWNCNHLANGNKKQHIRLMNTRLNLSIPEILTPLELFTETEP